MKNIEKYYYAITDNLKSKSGENLGCAVFDIRHGNDDCGDTDCLECCLKSLEWLNAEYKGHILNLADKEIVKAMIDFAHKCGVDVIHVYKFQDKTNGVYIYCEYKYKENKDVIASPWLPKNMFKGMEPERGYTLEELGITCPTQKDNYVRQ